LDVFWNPGDLAGAHQPIAQDCRACHSQGFSRVLDADCKVCHEAIGDHVTHTADASLPGQDVRCAECHRDHKGAFALSEQNQGFTAEQCAACHRTLEASYPQTKTKNVSDFARDHPPFRLQLADGQSGFKRVRADTGSAGKLTEPTGLKFPHDAHLAPGGIHGPNGRQKMVCADCHTPESDGAHFKPVTMKDHCQSCHSLGFEPAAPGRQVPHGSVAEVLDTLREFYGYVASSGVPIDRPLQSQPVRAYRPGGEVPAPSFINSPGSARARASAAAVSLFEKTGCVVCHEIRRTQGPDEKRPGQDLPHWSVAAVTPQHAFMPKARFDHAPHVGYECAECHQASSSKKASEVLMPSIETCRECHAGSTPVAQKVSGDCGVCHGFHEAAPASKPAALVFSGVK
jgi:predicted CXXCH cytochrome family protein